jgi:hypothetical protein
MNNKGYILVCDNYDDMVFKFNVVITDMYKFIEKTNCSFNYRILNVDNQFVIVINVDKSKPSKKSVCDLIML